MAIVSYYEINKDEGRFAQTGELRRYFVCVTNPGNDPWRRADTPLAIYAYRPDLQYGQRHPDDASYTVTSNEAIRREQADVWDVTVTYQQLTAENPLNEPAKVKARSQDDKRAALYDADGKPYLNTAGDFLEPVEEDEAIWVYSVTKNVASVPAWFDSYPNRVNDDAVRLMGRLREAGTLKLKGGSIDEADYQGQTYYVLSFELWWRLDGWEAKVVNRGYNQLVEITENPPWLAPLGQQVTKPKTRLVRQPILINGQPPREPQALDNDGKWIENPTPEDIVLLSFKPKPWLPFSVLPLT